jgi:hypothetical protein
VDSEVVWMFTEPSAILVMYTSLLRTVVFFLFKEAYFYAGWLPVTARCAIRGLLGPMRWVDVGRVGQGARFVAGGQPDFRRQYVEVLALPQTVPETKPPPRPPRAARWRQSFRWQDRLARPCRLGTTACA